MTFPKHLGRTALALALALGTATAARATVVERVIAVVGEHAILLTDMRHRARPFLLQIAQRIPTGAQQAAAESEMMKQLLDRMVDERLEQQAAERAHLTVSSEEIDAGIRNVAGQQGLSTDQLLAEATKSGLTIQEYRDEVRRQILEGKLLQLRVKGRVRVTEDDVKSTYQRILRAERKRLGYHIAWVVVRIPPNASPAERADKERLAESIAATARAGIDAHGNRITFGQLAKSFSDDTPSRGAGGDLGTHRPGDLAQVIEDEVMKLDTNAVSTPFRYKDALVVVKLLDRDPSQVPALAEAHDEVMQRAYAEQMDKARRDWLDELRRGVYLDIRL